MLTHVDETSSADLPPEARLSYQTDAPQSDVSRGAKSIEQIVREADGPNLNEIQVDEAAATQVQTTDGAALDFPAIYRAAKVPDSTFGAEQMLETLNSLPTELPLDTKRATVKAMLATLGKTMGATPETVVADASRKLAALESFAGFMEKKTTDLVAKNETEIAELQAQIETRRTQVLEAKTELSRVTQTCESEADRLDDVLEFFSLDVGASKHAPVAPKEPTIVP